MLLYNLSFFQFFKQFVKVSDVPFGFLLYLFPDYISSKSNEAVLAKQKWIGSYIKLSTNEMGIFSVNMFQYFKKNEFILKICSKNPPKNCLSVFVAGMDFIKGLILDPGSQWELCHGRRVIL